MSRNDNISSAVNDSDPNAFDVEGNPLGTDQLWPIDQAALFSGVTTRTLRYYDETGLVKPTETSTGGKRWYDWPALVRLQFVIMLRDAGLSIVDIAAIMQSGGQSMRQALDAKSTELRRDIETLTHKLQVLHNLSDLCDADGDIDQMDRLTGNPVLAQVLVASAARWSMLGPEERERARQDRESKLRQSQETMVADAEQWKRLFAAGAAPDSPEAQRFAEQILDRDVETARVQAAQNPVGVTAAMPLSDSLGAVRSALSGDPRFVDPCGEALYGSKACADFVSEAKAIHARKVAGRFTDGARSSDVHQ